MTGKVTRHRESPDSALLALISAIASRDAREAARLLDASPELARQAAVVGATREAPREYFFETIAHYVYGGDTALHIAAAAYDTGIAATLVDKGASPGARN